MKAQTRIWLPAAVALLLGALAAETFAKREAGLGMQTHARAAQARNDGEPVDRARVAAAARGRAGASAALTMIGLAMAMLGVGCWFVLLRRGQPGPRWVPPALVALHAIWLLMLA